MNILITGATGFVGKKLTRKLAEQHNVAILVRDTEKSKRYFSDTVQHISCQTKWRETVNTFAPTIVIHLASLLTSKDDIDTIHPLIAANITFGTELLEALTGIDCFINIGSFSEYSNNDTQPDPGYLYAATKTAFRYILKYYAKSKGFTQTTVVPYTIYGEGDKGKKIVNIIIESLDAVESKPVSPGQQVLDFIHVDDLVVLLETMVSKQEEIVEETYYAGSGTGITIKELARTIEKISGKKANLGWGKFDYRKTDIMRAVADISKTTHDFGWTPNITLTEGIKRILRDSS